MDNLQIDDVEFWGSNRFSNGGMKIYWSSDIGFGEWCILKNKTGLLHCYTEYMDGSDNKDFTSKLLELLLCKLIIVD